MHKSTIVTITITEPTAAGSQSYTQASRVGGNPDGAIAAVAAWLDCYWPDAVLAPSIPPAIALGMGGV